LVLKLDEEEEARLETLQTKYGEYNNNPVEYNLGYYTFDVNVGGLSWAALPLIIKIKANEFSIDSGSIGGYHPPQLPKRYPLPLNAASLNEDSSWMETYFTSTLSDLLFTLDLANLHHEWSPDNANTNNVFLQLQERINSTMRYNLRGVKIDDYTPNIVIRINDIVANWQNVYVPIFTRKIIEDKYPVPDDGFTFEIASDMSDGIKWIAQNKNLLVGTETAEWVIPAGVNAANVQAVLNSRYGSDSIQGTSVGDAMCFFQTGKKALIEYYIPQQDYNFRANNMAMLSKNMLHESPAFDFDFISAPYTKLFVSREDGTIVCLLYERSTGTFAWGRITTGREIEAAENGKTVRTRTGLIKSVATVPGPSGYDDVFLVVRRGADFFLERHSERVREDGGGDAAVFLDSYQPWDGDPQGYADDAVVYDETDNRTYPVTQGPIPDHVMWIGYPYESRVRSMPVLANDRMKQNNIKNLYIRFNDSFMPKLRSVSMEEGKERMGNTDTIGRPEPYSGVVQLPFPGVWDRDVFFELIHDRPTRCRVLAVNAEAN
jgi:hypothetical protein